MTDKPFPRSFIFSSGFFDGTLFVRFHDETHADCIHPAGKVEPFGGILSSVTGQCATGHWEEITERAAWNMELSYLYPSEA